MKKILDFINRDLLTFTIKQNRKINKGKEKYSGFLRRFGAALSDLAFFSLLLIGLTKFGLMTFSDSLFIFLMFPLYSAVCLYFFGMTLGKYVFGIKLIKKNRQKINIFTLIRREYILKPISIIFFGFGLWRMFFDSRKQTYYDKKLGLDVVVWRNGWITYLFIFATVLSLISEVFSNIK